MSNLRNKGRYEKMPKNGDIYYIKVCNGKCNERVWMDSLQDFVDWDSRPIFKDAESCLKHGICKNGRK